MSRFVKRSVLVLASWVVVASATTAEAARVAVHAHVAKPAPVAVRGGATVVHATPYRPAAGPAVVHASRTAWRR